MEIIIADNHCEAACFHLWEGFTLIAVFQHAVFSLPTINFVKIFNT